MTNDVEQRVISVIAKFKKMPAEDITVNSSLKDLILDSLDGINLIFELEEEFKIHISDESVLEMKKVKEIVEGIEQLLDAENSS